MTHDHLQFKIDSFDRHLALADVPAKDVAKIITMIADIIEQASGEADSEAGRPDISIGEVSQKSLWIVQRLSQRAKIAAVGILTALATGDFDAVPASAHRQLILLSRLLIGQGRYAVFSGLEGLTAEISASRPVPELLPRRVQHRTTLYGQVVSAGGAKVYKAAMILTNTGRVAEIHVADVELVKLLAARLYDVVGVQGTAWTDLRTREMELFTAERLTPYRGKAADPRGALDSLAARHPDLLRGVDIPAFVSDLRDGEED